MRLNFRERVQFGKTGLMVSRMGVGQAYGLSAAAIEKAVHEYGINYLYVSPILNLRSMIQAVHNLAPSCRDDLCIVLGRPFLRALRLEVYVERWLKKLKLEWIDLLFQCMGKPPSRELIDRVQRLKDAGKVRFVGMSSHKRPLFGAIARGEVEAPVDFFHIRYNAVHTGAEQDIFPFLPEENRPGIGIFTATCWRKLVKPGLMPPDERPPAPADVYRFVLSHPDVDLCLMAPSTEARMLENLKALDAGPLDEEEMSRLRRIGKHIYGK